MAEVAPAVALPRALLTAGAALVAATAIDAFTGFYVRAYPLYFVPVAYASVRLGRSGGLAFAVLGAAAWVVSNIGSEGAPKLPVWLWVLNSVTQAIAFAFVAVLIAELQRRLTSERLLSRQDLLTGLSNGRAFREEAERALAVTRRTGRPCTVACLDLDGFKSVNDTLGHGAGDDLLRDVGKALRGCVREIDLVARLGGDEFAIVIPDGDVKGSVAMLERVRAAVSREVPGAGRVTTSIGALSVDANAGSLDEVLRSADALMYRAKAEGKDRVVVDSATATAVTKPPTRSPDAETPAHPRRP